MTVTPWQTQYDHPVRWDMSLEPTTLPHMFATSADAFGTLPLIDFMGARLTYAAVARDVRRFASALTARGFATGDRIGLLLPNVPDYPISYYGALSAGGIVVNLSPLYSLAELRHQIVDSGTRIVVTSDVPQLYANAVALLSEGLVDRLIVGSLAGWLPFPKRQLFRLLRRGDIARPDLSDGRIERMTAVLASARDTAVPVTVAPGDVALIQYTGGTTGVPKGAMLTHRNLTVNAQQVAAIDPQSGAPDRIVGVLPLFHVFANTCVLNRTVLTGGMIAMLPRFVATDTLATIARVKATALPGVPTMYQALFDQKRARSTDFTSLRVCISGGAPLAQSVKDKFEQLTGARTVEGYGLTETAGVVAVNPYEAAGKAGTIGQPLPGTRVWLIDREDPTRRPAPGQPGELVVAGPQVMAGYWQRPEADGDTFVGVGDDRGLRTGDVATIDADGYIRIVDRLKDMIAVGGFKVFPSQIEAVLYRHPAVREAIVIGIPDAYHGEVPKAFVTLNADATNDGDLAIDGDTLRTWLNPQLGKHERVQAVEVRAELPKTLVGKLSRKELVAEARSEAG